MVSTPLGNPAQPVTLDDVYAARRIIYRTLRPTPLLWHPLLDAATGLTIYVKHENHNPTTAFKNRGGLNLIGRQSGVIGRTHEV